MSKLTVGDMQAPVDEPRDRQEELGDDPCARCESRRGIVQMRREWVCEECHEEYRDEPDDPDPRPILVVFGDKPEEES